MNEWKTGLHAMQARSPRQVLVCYVQGDVLAKSTHRNNIIELYKSRVGHTQAACSHPATPCRACEMMTPVMEKRIWAIRRSGFIFCLSWAAGLQVICQDKSSCSDFRKIWKHHHGNFIAASARPWVNSTRILISGALFFSWDWRR